MNDVLHLSATDLIAAYRSRQLSPVEVLDAVVARAEAVEDTVNAFAEQMYESAKNAALEAEARYAGRGDAPRPLEGVPVAVKEEQPIEGRSLRYGSLTTEGLVGEVTHPVVERVLDAGAVVHARTTTPEFSCAAFTHSDLWGVTRNPWNTEFGPGGSSGGAAAALASGTAYLATGSDIGGSIRMPASLCGVVGYKPPYGRVPGLPPFNLDVYCHDGPLARTVADTALLENVIAGPHRADPVALPPAPPLPERLEDGAGLTVAFARTVGDYPVDPAVLSNTEAFATALREAGLRVVDVEVPIERATVMRAALAHFGAIFAASISEPGAPADGRLASYTKHFARVSEAMLGEIGVFGGMLLESAVHAAIADVLADHDALVCPTMGFTGLVAGDDYVEHGVTVAGVDLPLYIEGSLTPIFNIASRHPVLNVPSGIAANGVPTGVQIVGRAYDDLTPFRVGAAAEAVLGWWSDPAWRPPLG